MDTVQFLAELRGNDVPAYPLGMSKVEALYAAGHWLLSQERFVDAAKIFRMMLRLAPSDERSWLALGTCHERIGQHRIALELYGTGSVLGVAAVRCHLARARTLRVLDRDDEADAAMDRAEQLAAESDDDELVTLVLREKGRRAA